MNTLLVGGSARKKRPEFVRSIKLSACPVYGFATSWPRMTPPAFAGVWTLK
jgi:hypothetical protein